MRVNHHLLGLLSRLKSSSQPLSGELLAEELGVSRVALWKRIQGLRSLGYTVHSDRHGYRLVAGDEALPWEFPPNEPPVHFYQETSSTMDLAAELARGGSPTGTVVAAARQTKGRGTQGRPWLSPTGGLYFTMILHWDFPLSRAGALALESLTTLAEVLEAQGVHGLRLVWPNDLFRGNSKVGGLLLETQGGLHRPEFWLLGIGLNVHPPAEADLKVPKRSWALVDGPEATVSRKNLVEDFRKKLLALGSSPSFRPQAWEARSWPQGTLLDLYLRDDFDPKTQVRLQDRFNGFNSYGDLVTAERTIRFGDCFRVEGDVS